ncbi:MAG TPA: MarR family transcriptional regulator [Solirubrobacteraceae bacterium]|nr:MarR family transcriptional regulator [Solirubrobacteraceae bacterium]
MPETPVPPPPLIGALLRIPFETVRDRMLAGLHERGYSDLIAAHLDVLQYPGPENMRPSELAAHTRMSKQALNYLLGQLEQLGYLSRETDTSDQRSKRIHLTPRGHAAITAIREIVSDVEAEWRQQLGPRKFAQLRDLLAQLRTTTATSAGKAAGRGEGGAGRQLG